MSDLQQKSYNILKNTDISFRSEVLNAVKRSGKKLKWLAEQLGYKSEGGFRKALDNDSLNPVVKERLWKLLGESDKSQTAFVGKNEVVEENLSLYKSKVVKLAEPVNKNLPVENPGIISLPYYDINSRNLPMLTDLIKTEPKDIIRMPGHEGGDFTFKFFAKNMIGLFNPGDILTAQILEDRSEFIPGMVYLVIRKNSREVGYLYENETPDHYTLVSHNTTIRPNSDSPQYPDYYIPKDSVIDLAFIIGSGTINRWKT